MAGSAGVTLALQNHKPLIENYQHVLEFIAEVDSPSLKVCLDAPLLNVHTEAYYRQALTATGSLMVHTHFGGRFERLEDGQAVPLQPRPPAPVADYATFLRLADEIAGFDGHVGYELCSPVLVGHRHAGLDYALLQAQLAGEYVRQILDALP